MTKVEHQQYLASVMKTELSELQEQFDNSKETALKRIEKAQVNQDSLSEFIAEHLDLDTIDIDEDIVKV